MDTNWFREALRRAGKSQAELARDLTLPPSAVSRMLAGSRQMKIEEAVVVAEFLGVSQDEVLRHALDEGISTALLPRGRGTQLWVISAQLTPSVSRPKPVHCCSSAPAISRSRSNTRQ